MVKAKELHSDMAHARQSDGINVIFDQKSPARSRSRSSSSGGSPSSASSRGRQRGRYRSSSSSSSSRSSCHSRSRSRPRCHRGSSRCRCENHSRYGRGRYRRSPPLGYRTRHHSHPCSPSPDGYSRRRHYRSRSRSSGHQSRRRNRRIASRSSRRDSRSPRTQRSRPRSPSPGRSVHLSLEDKRKLLEAAQANAMRTLGRNNLELPESVKPILSAPESVKPILSAMPPSKWELPETRVRHDLDKAPSQSEAEADEAPCPKMSPKSKMIAFSMNNSVAKPTVAVSGAKVTARADSYESRKPYGHWVPVKSV
ncbi:arginine/serine-rich protein 1 isoform X1 [Takifugu rubripes]|uniref:arginine/serine-rich protein 1 isoform X1 n=1 Tax=Takifugu rubripes TaxID=31033 RepID=UPI0005D172DF|nr:arginine/serine-rich protein 1 isoform X1 [Takifugu rubripes]|eukprot:XP_011613958.1 PREDICTED: arginine/serine-rich protein 1 isoform X1 [Takifugu rubripes]